jgi:hypothetical protein
VILKSICNKIYKLWDLDNKKVIIIRMVLILYSKASHKQRCVYFEEIHENQRTQMVTEKLSLK